MILEAIAEVYAKSESEPTWAAGSGYHIGNGLILTSRHVVVASNGPRSKIEVRLLGAARRLTAELKWYLPNGADMALIAIEGADEFSRRTPSPIRWGYFATSLSGQPGTGAGYPAVSVNTDGVRDTEQFSGTINPLTIAKSGRFALTIQDAPTPIGGFGNSPWQGISGAAVFSRGFLVGVVAQDRDGFQSNRLICDPIWKCRDDERFTAIVERYSGHPLIVEPVEVSDLFSVTQQATNSPIQLLRADQQVVPFRGRDRELSKLGEWCSDDTRFSARLLVGTGGEGKTRLAHQFINTMLREGWVAGFIRDASIEASIPILPHLQRPTLIVLDYAETRQQFLSEIAHAMASAGGAPMRLLLLARTAGDWRYGAAADHHSLAWLPTLPTITLAPLEQGESQRIVAWNDAAQAFAERLARFPELSGEPWQVHLSEVLSTTPRWALSTPEAATVLGIHIDALAALLAQVDPELGELPDLEALLVHERRYWRKAAATRSLLLDDMTAASAVAAATLWGAETVGEAAAVVNALPGTRDLPEDRRLAVVYWLASIYPAEGKFWGKLQPDRVGESHVSAVLSQRPEVFMSALQTVSERQGISALTVLARATPATLGLTELILRGVLANPGLLGPCAIKVAPQVAQPQPVVDALEHLLDASQDMDAADCMPFLEQLVAALPTETSLLASIAERIMLRYTACHRELAAHNPEDLPGLARTLTVLSRRRQVLGMRQRG